MALYSLIIVIFIFTHLSSRASGHGSLVETPSRSSMWRFGFKTKPNYNDNELFCGEYTVQWQRNGGKCGVCGDAWHLPKPRPNEDGGVYGRGIIVRNYNPGLVV
ncbi:chitin-binding type-4 domain-containing protein, partial [Nephila pilipes]